MSLPCHTMNAGDAQAAGTPFDDPNNIIVSCKEGVSLIDTPQLKAYMQLPLPGIVILVHGVNSDGEWYEQAEEGLCQGLNERLKRCDEHMVCPSAEGGQLTPAKYMPELTADGYINPKRSFASFIQVNAHFSPVIRFRWGYMANSQELQDYSDSIALNEKGYWGGGPFANGCTALPDLWGEGLTDDLFLWFQVEHLNPVPGRTVYACPPRAYYVFAALRLAKLIESIRKLQADVPITVVCHSQGNMIGIAAAFLGDRLPMASDPSGKKGRCVADTYVLANAPYSLLEYNPMETWMQGHVKDKEGRTGRQTGAARTGTLRAFFDIIREPASQHQPADEINRFMANRNHGFDAAQDRETFGQGSRGGTCGKVTLYCNPHDQVISATTVQGIGWRGLSEKEIEYTNGTGVFYQRVFAQDFLVGPRSTYHFWKNHHRKIATGSRDFWFPHSKTAKYSLKQGLAAKRTVLGKVATYVSAPIAVALLPIFSMPVNAVPDADWKIPINAPDLPGFYPAAQRYGVTSTKFDEGYDRFGQSRDALRKHDDGDAYKGDREVPEEKRDAPDERSDAARGDVNSEAYLRYEDHARLRMKAKREGCAPKGERTTQEDNLSNAGKDYIDWRNEEIQGNLLAGIDANATDHSTILTTSIHSERVLSYDVAIGVVNVTKQDITQLRVAADWRLLSGLSDSDLNKGFLEYFQTGSFKEVSLKSWANDKDGEGSMPQKIADQRENRRMRETVLGGRK